MPQLQFRSGDSLYSSTRQGMAHVQWVSSRRDALKLNWVTGPRADRETVESLAAVEAAVDGPGHDDWQLVARASDGSRRTYRLLDEFLNAAGCDPDCTRGDRVSIPSDEDTARRLYAHGWCDPDGRLGRGGAAIRSYTSALLSHRPAALDEHIARDGLPLLFDRAVAGVDAVAYDELLQSLDIAPVDRGAYEVKVYPVTEAYINFSKGDEEAAADLKHHLEADGHEVQYREDKRFSNNTNPRRLTVEL